MMLYYKPDTVGIKRGGTCIFKFNLVEMLGYDPIGEILPDTFKAYVDISAVRDYVVSVYTDIIDNTNITLKPATITWEFLFSLDFSVGFYLITLNISLDGKRYISCPAQRILLYDYGIMS